LKRLALLTAAALLLTGCASTPAPASEQVQEYYNKNVANATMKAPAPAAKQISYAAYGDSITEGNSPAFVDGEFGSLSWATYLGSSFRFAGGWAKGGVQTNEMLSNAKPVKAEALVLLAGANDYIHDTPFAVTAANLDGIVKKTGIKRVVISAVPPNDQRPEAASAFNVSLKQHAAARKWAFIDPMKPLRNGENYAPGMSHDGIHPTERAAKLIGGGIAAALKG